MALKIGQDHENQFWTFKKQSYKYKHMQEKGKKNNNPKPIVSLKYTTVTKNTRLYDWSSQCVCVPVIQN